MSGDEPQESEETAEQLLTEVEASERLRSHGPVEKRPEIIEPKARKVALEAEFLLERSNGESN